MEVVLKKLYVLVLLIVFTYADTTLCTKSDEVVFSCDIKKKKLSVCKQNNHEVIYRYGTPYKVELEIKSKPKYSYEQFIRANYEEHLRFHNKGYDYIVYANEFLEYDKHPNDGTQRYVEHSGVYVVKNKKLLARLACNKLYKNMMGNMSKDILKEQYIGY